MLRCGKTPRDGSGALFTAVTQLGSRLPIAPLLEVLAHKPAVGHQGNRGLDRQRIEQEGLLFARAQQILDSGAVPAGAPQNTVHAELRKALLPNFTWLADAATPRITPAENAADWLRLGGFLCLFAVGCCLPGIVLSLFLPPIGTLIVLALLGIAAAMALGLFARPKPSLPDPAIDPVTLPTVVASPPGAPAPPGVVAGALIIVVLFLIALAAIWAFPASFHHWRPEHFPSYFRRAALHVALGLLGVIPLLAAVLAIIRWNEQRDPPQDAPRQDLATLRAMAAREDKIAQNHMGSIVHLKPGVLRAITVHVALHALGLVLRIKARNGYLGSMRTIHFAHWAIISNGARLLFFSNFDGSWESYLDDFIEKAHAGLTLAWTSGVGFPPTRYLVLDGATRGRKFKNWARHSMAESLFWYSGYEDFTVNQIERQHSVANGLRQKTLTDAEAAAWALNL